MRILNTEEVPEASNGDMERKQIETAPAETKTPCTNDKLSTSRITSKSSPHNTSERDTFEPGTNPNTDTDLTKCSTFKQDVEPSNLLWSL